MENTSWKSKHGTTCAGYAKAKWCENGGIGSAWQENWSYWATGTNGLNALQACCVCGGNKESDKSHGNLKIL